jgi:hypothetical protein
VRSFGNGSKHDYEFKKGITLMRKGYSILTVPLVFMFVGCVPPAFRPGELSASNPDALYQNGRAACQRLNYETYNQPEKRLKIEDKFQIEVDQIQGASFSFVANQGFVDLCVTAGVETIPGEYILNLRGSVNGNRYEGKLKLFVNPPTEPLVRFDLPSNFSVLKAQSSCITIASRLNSTVPFTNAPASQLDLKFTVSGKLSVKIDPSRDAPICFMAAQDALPGRYNVQIRGRVNGIGTSRTLEIVVQ